MTLLTNDMNRVTELDRAHVWHHMFQHKALETTDPRIIVRGRGMTVWDQKGREFLDALSGGVWTVNVGYGRESIADAVRDMGNWYLDQADALENEKQRRNGADIVGFEPSAKK